MKPLTSLPHTASAEDIAQVIREIQRRCRKGLCTDPDALGRLVRAQLDRAQAMADAVGLPLRDLSPSMHAWMDDNRSESVDSTIVMVDRYAIRIARMNPFATTSSGRMMLGFSPARGDA